MLTSYVGTKQELDRDIRVALVLGALDSSPATKKIAHLIHFLPLWRTALPALRRIVILLGGAFSY